MSSQAEIKHAKHHVVMTPSELTPMGDRAFRSAWIIKLLKGLQVNSFWYSQRPMGEDKRPNISFFSFFFFETQYFLSHTLDYMFHGKVSEFVP